MKAEEKEFQYPARIPKFLIINCRANELTKILIEEVLTAYENPTKSKEIG